MKEKWKYQMKNNRKHYSPLRYPGGKQSLGDFFSELVELNDLEGGSYIEPFAGGAGAALSLLFAEKVYKIVLNDKDHHLYCFWQSVLQETEDLNRKIRNTPVNITEYERQKAILSGEIDKYSVLEKGFAAFYMNRCNRSGILKAGPIGGRNQDGNWKIDARFNKEDLINRIERIANYGERIEVYNHDALNFLDLYVTHLPLRNQKVLVYLDPPYYKKGNDLYRFHFKENDHIIFAEYFKRLENFRWLISYDDSDFIRNLFASSKQSFLKFNYFANKAKVGRELMIFSNDCVLPERYLLPEEIEVVDNVKVKKLSNTSD